MNNSYTKVIERLSYEGYLRNPTILPMKRQITLNDCLEAGAQEPRILELLPGLILLTPKLIRNIKRDLEFHPEVKDAMKNLSLQKIGTDFLGIPMSDCMKQEQILRKIRDKKKAANKSKNLNLRVSNEDLRQLERLSRKLGKTKSETIRYLLSL